MKTIPPQYLIGFSHKHQRMAHFRVDRLSGIKILPSGFTPDEDFDVAGYEILTKQFIHRFNSTEKELLDELNMERSVFYDRKREAIFLLSLCLFGYAVPELQEELEMPRLYPD